LKRFDDILRVISGVLLGVLVRDFDNLSGGFESLYRQEPRHFFDEAVAGATAFLVAIAFLRNIHGSARYDDFLKEQDKALQKQNKELSLASESTYFGRTTAFALALASLFFGPFWVNHEIANHASRTSTKEFFTVILFFPFLIFAIWDFRLWFLEDDESQDWRRTLAEITHKWVRIDAIAILILLSYAALNLYLRTKGIIVQGNENTELSSVVFLLTVSFMIVADYLVNKTFYFSK
jgi:hypothetical protein